MAVSLDVLEKSLEDLEKEVTCGVCQEYYQDPKILPCLHYYCKECVLRLALRTGKDKPFPCPECRKMTTLPEGGIEELKSAFFINRFRSIYEKHKKAVSKQVQCEICTNPDALAEAFCQECNKFACKTCMHMHSAMKTIFEGHHMVPIDQLQKVKAEELKPKNLVPRKCSVHSEPLKIFCFKCTKLICRDCTLKDHRDHNFEFNKVAAENKKKELMDSLEPLRELEDSLSSALVEVCSTEHKVKGQGESIVVSIETSFEELHKILEARKQQLIEETKGRVKEKTEKLKEQEKKLSVDSAKVCSVINYTEQYVSHCSDDEIMSIHTEISQRVKEELDAHSKLDSKREPVEVADVSVKIGLTEALHNLCQEAKVVHVSENIIIETPNTAEVNQKIEMKVVNMVSGITSQQVKLECEVKSLQTGLVSKPVIESTNCGDHVITYTPISRGRHEVLIRACGKPVSGSPFTLTIILSPAQLKEPFEVWEGVRDPFSIAVNSVGEVIVVENSKNILVYSKKRRKLKEISVSEHNIKALRSVAIDSEDTMYFVGYSSSNIGKSNRNCDIFEVHNIQQIKGPGYWDVAVLGDEVLVTELENEGEVMVYDRELKYIRQISCRTQYTLKHLHPDSHGNLYFSAANNTVLVFTMRGDLVRSISQYHNGVKVLNCPFMVYVCGAHVYVSDDNTVVFTIEGDYVTTLKGYGGSCIGQDGVLYVSDYENSKILCY